MSRKEGPLVCLVGAALSGKITNLDGARALRVSVRHLNSPLQFLGQLRVVTSGVRHESRSIRRRTARRSRRRDGRPRLRCGTPAAPACAQRRFTRLKLRGLATVSACRSTPHRSPRSGGAPGGLLRGRYCFARQIPPVRHILRAVAPTALRLRSSGWARGLASDTWRAMRSWTSPDASARWWYGSSWSSVSCTPAPGGSGASGLSASCASPA
jgi:hypothetical protein